MTPRPRHVEGTHRRNGRPQTTERTGRSRRLRSSGCPRVSYPTRVRAETTDPSTSRNHRRPRPPRRGASRRRGNGEGRRESLAQSRCRFRSRLSPQPDRPGPQSQSLSRSYGSDLPTSLTYIVLSARGCSPRRPAADMGTTRHENHWRLPRIFKGRRRRTGRHKIRGAFRSCGPYLRASRFQARPPLAKKRELFPGPSPASPSSFASPHWPSPEPRHRDTPSRRARRRAGRTAISVLGFGNIDPIPFRGGARGQSREVTSTTRTPRRPNGTLLSLRID